MLRFIILLNSLWLTSLLPAQSTLWEGTATVNSNTSLQWLGDCNAPISPSPLLRRPLSEAVEQSNQFNFAQTHMGARILEAALAGRMRLYQDEDLRKVYGMAEIENLLISIDTVVVFNSATYEETVHIVQNEPNPANFSQISLHLQLSYSTDGSITQTIRSGSFLIRPYDELGNPRSEGPQMYFAIQQANKPLKFRRRNWNMIDRHYISLPLSKVEITPTNPITTLEMIEHLMEQVQSGSNDNFLGVDGDYNALSTEERRDLGGTVDTITTFSPDDYSEHTEIVVNDYDPASLKQLRLLHYWAWDEGQAELTILPLGYALLQEVLDERGDLLYHLPLFYHVDARYHE
ncbi:MAG: hypothetical protein AAF433_04790 [Bacteroidota bacterium]